MLVDESHNLFAICASPTMAMPSTPADILTGPARDCGQDLDTVRSGHGALAVACASVAVPQSGPTTSW